MFHLLFTVEFDQECGVPIKMKIEDANIDGFRSKEDDDGGLPVDQGKRSKEKKKLEVKVTFLCVPVAPGKSRVIWAFSLTVVSWLDKMMPRWLYHIRTNSILDSDTYLLHIEVTCLSLLLKLNNSSCHLLCSPQPEKSFSRSAISPRLALITGTQVCYVPTSSDNFVITFRNWFRKYCGHQVGWLTPNVNQLPPATTRVEILERYWSHVKQCTSCRAALKGMRALEITLQVASVAVVGFLAAGKETAVTSGVQRAAVMAAAVLCFAASRWLANFIEKTFYFQDYVHADK
uniref:Pheophorbide a oxygenase domain-containing protein n=1 Tax=Oryza meridionalis TaxID=40149 RepID=A0A0E0D8J1_9ORYZ